MMKITHGHPSRFCELPRTSSAAPIPLGPTPSLLLGLFPSLAIHQGNPESAPTSLSTLGMQEVVWSPMVPLEALGGASIFDSQC